MPQEFVVGRLPAAELRKVTPEHISSAVQKLLAGHSDHGFGPSTDYDLIAANGARLPPKAVFGLALSEALGIEVNPKNFSAGESQTCFRILRAAGYQIV